MASKFPGHKVDMVNIMKILLILKLLNYFYKSLDAHSFRSNTTHCRQKLIKSGKAIVVMFRTLVDREKEQRDPDSDLS